MPMAMPMLAATMLASAVLHMPRCTCRCDRSRVQHIVASCERAELLEAQHRQSSNARAAFNAAVMDPLFKDPHHDPLELACLIAAEERFAERTVMPRHITDRIHSDIEQIAAPASKRVSLDRMFGTEVNQETIAVAVSSALFGTGAAPDDATVGEELGFFRGASVDYYDPRNSFLDHVLDRREGIPISLSLVAADACKQLGCPMVGLNAPSHLLLAPADPNERWVLDCFNGGAVMSEEEAAIFVATNLGNLANRPPSSGSDDDELQAGRTLLANLRASPMTPLQWAARMLRNLRSIYSSSGDVVRLLGVADRMRQIGGHSRIAVSDAEMRQCAAQVALCVYALRWTQRRSEALTLLAGLRRSAVDEAERARIDQLVAEPWFREQ